MLVGGGGGVGEVGDVSVFMVGLTYVDEGLNVGSGVVVSVAKKGTRRVESLSIKLAHTLLTPAML